MSFSLIESISAGMMNFVPGLVGSLAVFIIGWLLDRFIRKMVRIGLKKSKIDKYADKLHQIEIVSKSNIEIIPSKIISLVIYYFLMMMTLLIAADILKLPALTNLLQQIINYIPKLLVALTIIVIGTLIADSIKKAVYTAGKSLGIASIRMISSIIFYFLFITIVISALDQAGIETGFLQTSLTTIIGGVVLAFGLGYGLASKDILSNFLAGYYNSGKLKVGSTILIGGQQGVVTDIDKTSITIAQGENKTIIPLKKLIEEVVTIINDDSSKNKL